MKGTCELDELGETSPGAPSSVEGDAALILRLRAGDLTAYQTLWEHHIDAALLHARRLMPAHEEDLVAEGFLVMYQQIAVNKKGPDSAFRAYLFTVMRNMAARWYREHRQTDSVPELDSILVEDGLSALEERADAERILFAFQELPERWQRVLWLVEVEEVPRSEIAREFGIRPNAVSVLYRRAREGLRLGWLELLVPSRLRDDASHVARLLPRMLMNRQTDSLPSEISLHLNSCSTCYPLWSEMRTAHRSMRKNTFAFAGRTPDAGTRRDNGTGRAA